MKPKIKFFTIFSIILLLLISFSGCILDDWFSNNQKIEFEINKWEIVDDKGFPGLKLDFSCSDIVTLKIYNPENKLVDSDFFFKGENKVILYLSEYRKTLEPGQYKLKVYDKDNKLSYRKSFKFDDSYLKILSCEQYWWELDKSTNDKSLVAINMMIYNDGSFPLYPYLINLSIDSITYSAVCIPTVILAGETKQVDCCIYKKNLPQNETFDIQIFDVYNSKLGNNTFFVDYLNTVEEKKFTFNYRYKNNELYLPKLDFLLEHYENPYRIPNNDYSLYIFDPYDDDYIDILTEALLSKYKNEDRLEILNYAASFVQNLKYKEDISTGKAEEYPRYPYETLFNQDVGGGDCEDKAILTAAMLKNLDYNVSLIRLTNHMIVGVNLSKDLLTGKDYFIENYYFLETTTPNNYCGDIPTNTDISLKVKDIYPVSKRPILYHNWKDNSTKYTNTELGDFIKVIAIIENTGSSTANNVIFKATLITDNNEFVNTETIENIQIKPNTRKKVSLKINLAKNIKTKFKTIIYYNNDIVDNQTSIDYI